MNSYMLLPQCPTISIMNPIEFDKTQQVHNALLYVRMYVCYWLTDWRTHARNHSLTHSLTHAHTQPLTHSLAHSLHRSLARSLTRSLAPTFALVAWRGWGSMACPGSIHLWWCVHITATRLTLTQLGHFFSKGELFSNIAHTRYTISAWQ